MFVLERVVWEGEDAGERTSDMSRPPEARMGEMLAGWECRLKEEERVGGRGV